MQRLRFNDDSNRKRKRPLKTMEQHLLQNNNISADEFYRTALRAETDMVGNRPNRSTSGRRRTFLALTSHETRHSNATARK